MAIYRLNRWSEMVTVSTFTRCQLKNMNHNQIWNLPQVGVKIENIKNCHLVSRIQRWRCVFFGNPGWSTRKKKEKTRWDVWFKSCSFSRSPWIFGFYLSFLGENWGRSKDLGKPTGFKSCLKGLGKKHHPY